LRGSFQVRSGLNTTSISIAPVRNGLWNSISIVPGLRLPRMGMRSTSGCPAASCRAGEPFVKASPFPSKKGVTSRRKRSPSSFGRTSGAASAMRTAKVFPAMARRAAATFASQVRRS
jgi:hypothetical protein